MKKSSTKTKNQAHNHGDSVKKRCKMQQKFVRKGGYGS